jgi:hypothetical protein
MGHRRANGQPISQTIHPSSTPIAANPRSRDCQHGRATAPYPVACCTAERESEHPKSSSRTWRGFVTAKTFLGTTPEALAESFNQKNVATSLKAEKDKVDGQPQWDCQLLSLCVTAMRRNEGSEGRNNDDFCFKKGRSSHTRSRSTLISRHLSSPSPHTDSPLC